MKYFTYKLKLFSLNILSFAFISLLIIMTFLITKNINFLENINMFSLILMILWMFFHEIIHGIGFMALRKVDPKNVVFGMELENGVFYCMCKEKITKFNILFSIFLPFLLIGICTYIIGIVLSNDLLILLSIINMAGSIGDIIMGIDIIMMPRDIMYLDLDDATSFTIISKTDLSNDKYLAIELCESGEYDEKIKAKDYTRLKISRLSKYIIIIFLLLLQIYLLCLL